MKNIDLVAQTLNLLTQMDVAEIIVCAGARNAPFVQALEETDFKVFSFFEERSAAFFALGKVKATQRPVAVITTSGTAVAELLPAVIEAHYQGLPLIIISADRPKKYRGTGAPQAIEQVGIFSSYVEKSVDWDVNQTDFFWECSKTRPVHFNICFDEPLFDGTLSHAEIQPLSYRQSPPNFGAGPLPNFKRPFVIVGELDQPERERVIQFLKTNRLYHYAEFLSGLRLNSNLLEYQIQSTDRLVEKLFADQTFDSVIRLGGVPTLRFWRDLEFKYKNIPVASFCATGFSGLSRSSFVFSMAQLSDYNVQQIPTLVDLKQDGQLEQQKQKLLSLNECSEQNMVRVLADVVNQDPLYIGNSLPIREWDLCSRQPQKNQFTYANRGANGIDGQVSTYLGWSEGFQKSWCLIGDLTALYDLAALGLSSQLKQNKRNIVILNNSGGQIFNRVLGNKKFLNEHKVNFKAWAEMWDWDYQLITHPEELKNLNAVQNLMIEIKPQNSQSEQFWASWDQLCKNL